MNDLFKLLEDKNYWFKKYLSSNESFVAALDHAPDIALEELDFFYGNRESLLKIISGIDKKIQAIVESDSFHHLEPSSEQKTKINFYIREKDSVLQRIVELDRAILVRLDVLQKDFEEKLKAMGKGKKALAKYKSANKYNEKLDKQV